MKSWGGKRRALRAVPTIWLHVYCEQASTLNSTLNPPSLAEAINAKGFSGAAGFRIVAVEPGRAEVALARRDDLVQFFGHFHGGGTSSPAPQPAGVRGHPPLPNGPRRGPPAAKANFPIPPPPPRRLSPAPNLKIIT